MAKTSKEDKLAFINMTLDDKIKRTKQLVMEWYAQFDGKVYVPYSSVYDKGFERTGCMFCMYGCQNKNDKRFELMKKYYPKIYEYCMNKLGLKDVINFIKIGEE